MSSIKLDSSRGIVTIVKHGTHLTYNIPSLMDGIGFKHFKNKNKAVIKSFKYSGNE